MNWCVSAFSLPDSATAKWAKLKPKKQQCKPLATSPQFCSTSLCHIRSYLSQLSTWNLASGSVVSVVWLRHPSLRERRETQINSYKCRFWKLDASLPWIPEWDQWDFQNLWMNKPYSIPQKTLQGYLVLNRKPKQSGLCNFATLQNPRLQFVSCLR